MEHLERVLILEPDNGLRRRIVSELKRAGIPALDTADPEQALRYASDRSCVVVVADLRLLDDSGFSPPDAVRRHFPTADLLLLVTEGQLPATEDWFRNGRCDFSLKPVRLPELTQRVRHLLKMHDESRTQSPGPQPKEPSVDETEALQEAGSLINRTLGLQETLTSTMAMARSLIRASVANIFLYSGNRRQFDSLITLSEDVEMTDVDRRQATSVAQKVMNSVRAGRDDCTVLVAESDLAEDGKTSAEGFDRFTLRVRPQWNGGNLRSWLAVPLTVGKYAIGVMQLGSERPGTFGPEDVRLARLIGSQSATAIQSARLYEEAQHRLQQAEAMQEIGRNITDNFDLSRVLQLVVHLVTNSIPAATRSFLYLRDDRQGQYALEARFDRGETWPHPDVDPVREPVIVAATELRSVKRSSRDRRSAMAAPLISGNEVIGIILVEGPREDAFTAVDERLLEGFATHASIAIQNANLLRDLASAYANLSGQQEELLSKQNTLLALFDSITDGLYILDRDHRIVAVNRQEAKRLGVSQESLLGRQCDDDLWGECASDILDVARNTLFTSQAGNWECQGHTGFSGPFARRDVRTYPIFDSSGRVDRVILFAQDVAEKQWLQASLFHSANLAAVGQLASSIAHEINNPLTVAIANAEIMKMDSDPGSPDYVILNDILQSNIKIGQIVRNLVDFSSQDAYDWYETDVEQTLADALAFTASAIRSCKIQILRQPANLPQITASVSHLKLLWMNLILNARDAIVARLGDDRSAIGRVEVLTSQPDSEHVQVRIIDNGEGIPAEHQDMLFLPFFTTRAIGKGMGLGLHTCRTIVESHQGTIEVKNNPAGPGALACVTLPVRRKPTP